MKTVGVIPLIDHGRNSYWMLPGYLKGLQEAGALPVMLPVIESVGELHAVADMCDGFLFTGGQDVDPALYHSEKSPLCGECSPERDKMEMLILDEALNRDKPILGICRGIQFINAALGGTLWQDILTELPSDVTHCQKPPYDIPSHEVDISTASPLYSLLKKDKISVNSYHHQGVRELSPQLVSMASAPDGLIEAVYAPEQKYLWAVQWHPEFAYLKDENSRLIFEEFVRNC
ncbi:gamma-glutamyl-gamma-aminobutyrate hydrolase family protein [uncultured Ruminococcus sp.]|uniref:gamma-glutamyl-gamma-aminobutyrate hydrolase family protein n=1 Tax=uncultured Ruminococcus sp. TaxID=165186 RepID=UPI0025DB188B|nr:gamma-glutamyl-gamma-aminobutyrate hydrolase family protein [uncultured Ruminococcus sp.]